jgi:hypothetical protein
LKKQVMLAVVLGFGLLGALQVRAEVLPSFLTSAVDAPASCRTEAAAKPSFLRRGLPTKSTCTATCPAGGSIGASCSGTCTAVDVNCPSTAGYVLCNGVRSDCGACPPGPYCQSLNGTTCSPNGSTTQCTIAEGYPQTCTCRVGHWSCPF